MQLILRLMIIIILSLCCVGSESLLALAGCQLDNLQVFVHIESLLVLDLEFDGVFELGVHCGAQVLFRGISGLGKLLDVGSETHALFYGLGILFI